MQNIDWSKVATVLKYSDNKGNNPSEERIVNNEKQIHSLRSDKVFTNIVNNLSDEEMLAWTNKVVQRLAESLVSYTARYDGPKVVDLGTAYIASIKAQSVECEDAQLAIRAWAAAIKVNATEAKNIFVRHESVLTNIPWKAWDRQLPIIHNSLLTPTHKELEGALLAIKNIMMAITPIPEELKMSRWAGWLAFDQERLEQIKDAYDLFGNNAPASPTSLFKLP
jgi:hypothetical protein